MENQNQNVKRGRGRPRLFTDEERKNHKTAYMLGRPWYCNVCKNKKKYTLAGKSCHLKTRKHCRNVVFINGMERIYSYKRTKKMSKELTEKPDCTTVNNKIIKHIFSIKNGTLIHETIEETTQN